jgi:transposase InsO family protein
MRYSRAEKLEIIRLVEQSELPAKRTLAELQVSRASFYRWYRAYQDEGAAGVSGAKASSRQQFWNRIPDHERERVVEVALDKAEMSPRELAWHITDSEGWFISESSVYRILKAFDLVTSPNYIVMSAADKFSQPTRRVHELWQTDFTYIKIQGWGWYYLGTVLDDYSRYVICWRLFTGMAADDVKVLLDEAVALTGVAGVPVRHRPRLLSDNGPCYISKDLAEWMVANEMKHVRGKPYHPQTQGKIERYHRTMKNVVKLKNYWVPGELQLELTAFVAWYNTERYHESLENLTPEDVYVGRGREIQTQRQLLKMQTLRARRCYNRGQMVGETSVIRPCSVRDSVY